MIDAIYSAEFTLDNNKFGGGVVVLNQGELHGADKNYVYKGHYHVAETSVSATMVVDKYTDTPLTVLEPPTHFRLMLSGASTSDCFTLIGAVDGKPEHLVRIDLKKISGLDDE